MTKLRLLAPAGLPAPGCSCGRILGGDQCVPFIPAPCALLGPFTNFRQLTGRLLDAPAAPDCTDAPEKVGLTAIRTISFSRWRSTVKAPLIVGPLPLSLSCAYRQYFRCAVLHDCTFALVPCCGSDVVMSWYPSNLQIFRCALLRFCIFAVMMFFIMLF